MKTIGVLGWAVLTAIVGLSGCGKDEAPPPVKPREAPEFKTPAAPSEIPSSEMPAGHPVTTAHPTTMPAQAELSLKLDFPVGWVTQPPRNTMTLRVFALPKVEGDAEDADLTVMTLNRGASLQLNIDRWCSQFEYPAGKTCNDVMMKKQLEGTKYPTTIVEISGSFKGRSMFAAAGTSKPGYKMIAAEIVTPEKPWHINAVGPEKTIEHWRESFMKVVREAK